VASTACGLKTVQRAWLPAVSLEGLSQICLGPGLPYEPERRALPGWQQAGAGDGLDAARLW